jgi:hypothetical protein
MSKARLLHSSIWASVALAALFQGAFLFELHGPQPSVLALWFLSVVSVACVVVVLLARRSLGAEARLSYRPEKADLQRHSEVGAEYGVQGVYCVVLCRKSMVPTHSPRTKCFYLSEGSADRAVTTASVENPQWCAMGVEPSNLYSRMPQSDRSYSNSQIWHVA